jgi:phage FluMu protein Com
MSIEFRCSRCGKLLRTENDTVGRMAQCPQCSALTQVPEASETPSFVPASSDAGGPSSPGGVYAGSAGYQGAYQAAGLGSPSQGHPGGQMYALNRVSAPAVCLIVTAVLGLCLQVLGILANIFNVGLMAHQMGNRGHVPIVFTGPIAIGFGALGIILTIVVLVGAIRMKNLESYGLAMTASILALIPCTSPCCLLGLPFGIWAIVVLSDPVVKTSFKN